MSDTPRTDAVPHNVANLFVFARKLERELNAANAGGPAFARDSHMGKQIGLYVQQEGMSLRDYFAAAALQGLLADGHGNAWCNDTCSAKAFKLADAMLKARGGGK